MSFQPAERAFMGMVQERPPVSPLLVRQNREMLGILPEPNSPEPPQAIIAANGTDTG
jgi:hypothetical protein